jgi:hypothetical protein
MRTDTRDGGDRPLHERALAGAGDAGDDDKDPERSVARLQPCELPSRSAVARRMTA